MSSDDWKHEQFNIDGFVWHAVVRQDLTNEKVRWVNVEILYRAMEALKEQRNTLKKSLEDAREAGLAWQDALDKVLS